MKTSHAEFPDEVVENFNGVAAYADARDEQRAQNQQQAQPGRRLVKGWLWR